MRSLILTKYHFASLWNWRSTYLGRFIEPVAYLLFLAASLGSHLREPTGGYGTFVLTGLVCLLSFRAATSSMSDVSNDRKWGVYAIYSLSGGGSLGYLLSVVLFALAVFLCQLVMLVFFGLLIFGEGVSSVNQALATSGKGLLLVGGWTGIGAAVGARVHSYSTRDFLVTITSLPVILAAPLFYPIDDSSGFVFYVASLNPLTYQVGWLRDSDPSTILFSALWAAAALLLAFFMLRGAERVSSER
ncbi:MAG: ABC transporter permease [Sinomonas sp.]|nr:ABC transporter permease [Sinomonas sp.]